MGFLKSCWLETAAPAEAGCSSPVLLSQRLLGQPPYHDSTPASAGAAGTRSHLLAPHKQLLQLWRAPATQHGSSYAASLAITPATHDQAIACRFPRCVSFFSIFPRRQMIVRPHLFFEKFQSPSSRIETLKLHICKVMSALRVNATSRGAQPVSLVNDSCALQDCFPNCKLLWETRSCENNASSLIFFAL